MSELFIDGEWAAGTGPAFASRNPGTGATVWKAIAPRRTTWTARCAARAARSQHGLHRASTSGAR